MKGKPAYLGLLLAFAMTLSYIETLIPFAVGIPGVKLGLANLAVVLCLYLFRFREAFLLTVVKAVVCGFLFGNLSMIIYSLAGAVLSCLVMAAMVKSDSFHIPVVSAVGGVMHNAGQLLVAYITVRTYGVVYYVPVLIISGLLTGIVIGTVTSLVLPYIKTVMKRSGQL